MSQASMLADPKRLAAGMANAPSPHEGSRILANGPFNLESTARTSSGGV